ncbi:hypothetical protein BOTNAR_0969g00010 [Botryotinia narcissicola]|uniref:Uncharacterized protein n=1 Tax=Botryotinia narcissicola TaxID=278944 RepID=A0A4Z1H7K2_9HELO|nr:hypothetical protein BOTNAR_0969g00010 [Botryotinia narcissicola]
MSSRIREKGEVATSPVGAYVDRSENNTAALCFKKRKELLGGLQDLDSILSSKSTGTSDDSDRGFSSYFHIWCEVGRSIINHPNEETGVPEGEYNVIY